MSTNSAITARDNLKKAIKAGKAECGSVAANLEKIINEALWEYLDLPGDNPADKLHGLITLPYDREGLNTDIWQVDALLGLNPSTQRKFRDLVHAAKQGERNDLKEDKPKVEAKISPRQKSKGDLSASQKASDRACSRAAKAVPELENLLDEDLVSKQTAAKLGQVVKDPVNPTEKEQQVLKQQKEVEQKLKKIVPNPLPEEPSARKELQKKVKQVIEETTGKISKPKVTLGDPQQTAKAIADAARDLDYLQQLLVALELEVEALARESSDSLLVCAA